MAESTANFLVASAPGTRCAVLAGNGHVFGRDGLPERIAKRLPGTAPRPFVVVPRSVNWATDTGLPLVSDPGRFADADVFWYTQYQLDDVEKARWGGAPKERAVLHEQQG